MGRGGWREFGTIINIRLLDILLENKLRSNFDQRSEGIREHKYYEN